MTTYTVSSAAALNTDIANINGDSAGSYTIELTGSINESTDLTAIKLQSGVSLTIEGGTLDGGGHYRGLFV
jgi:hypothetical protein